MNTIAQVIPSTDKSWMKSVPCKKAEGCMNAKCGFMHPETRIVQVKEVAVCKWGSECKTVGCTFSHPEGKTIAVCKYGSACFNKACKFDHPEGKTGVKPCLNGVKCRKTECQFAHPEGRVAHIPCESGAVCFTMDCQFSHPKGWNPIAVKKAVVKQLTVEECVKTRVSGAGQVKKETTEGSGARPAFHKKKANRAKDGAKKEFSGERKPKSRKIIGNQLKKEEPKVENVLGVPESKTVDWAELAEQSDDEEPQPQLKMKRYRKPRN